MIQGLMIHEEVRSTSKSEFFKRHPHPFLIREISSTDLGSIGFFTGSAPHPSVADLQTPLHPVSNLFSIESRAAFSSMPKSPPPPAAKIATRLYLHPERYGLLPIQKRGESPWQERILVGRAPNNDIILRDASVSKSHAHFSLRPDGAWVLIAKKTTNGTSVDGISLDVGGSILVRAGSALQFGNVPSEFITSEALFDLFAR